KATMTMSATSERTADRARLSTTQIAMTVHPALATAFILLEVPISAHGRRTAPRRTRELPKALFPVRANVPNSARESHQRVSLPDRNGGGQPENEGPRRDGRCGRRGMHETGAVGRQKPFGEQGGCSE